MNKQQILREIQNIINTADPSRMELKFGCEVILEKEDIDFEDKGFRTVCGVTYDSGKEWRVCEFTSKRGHKYKTIQVAEILGQKPELQGVLLACSKKGFLPDGEVRIDQWGQLSAIHDITGERMMDYDIQYNLSLPFDQQELSTLTAILELLKK